MRRFWLFQRRPEGIGKGKSAFYWLWNWGLMVAAGVSLGCLSMLYAYGRYDPEIFYDYFERPLLVVLNVVPVVVFVLGCWCFTGRGWLAFFLSGFVTLGFSMADYFMLKFRDDPLMFRDLKNVREALSITVTANYDLTPDKRIFFGIACLVGGTVVLALLCRSRLRFKERLLLFAALLVLSVPLSTLYRSDSLYRGPKTDNSALINTLAPTQVYLSKGFVYPFLHSVADGIDFPPEGYRQSKAEALLGQYQDEDIPAEKKVDVIAIQLEAFADFSRLGDIPGIDFEKAYGLYHEIESEGISGDLITNIFAGGTIDTERAFLTGFANQRDVRKKTNSYVWYLQQQGYTVEGSHPSYQWFYNRQNVNRYLGLEQYYFFENYFEAIEPRFMAPDRIFFPEMEKLYFQNRTDEPYFGFHVTYQGHGPYSRDFNEWGETFTDGRFSTETTFIVDNYLASLKDTAECLRLFLNRLEEESRGVVVVLYGDHMPWLGDGSSAYMELGVNLDTSTEEGFANYYGTRYLIWGNSAAKEALGTKLQGEGLRLSSCFLMNEVFSRLGWTGSAWMQAGETVRQTLPVITAWNRYEEKGILTEVLTEEGKEALQTYEYLEYYLWEHFVE